MDELLTDDYQTPVPPAEPDRPRRPGAVGDADDSEGTSARDVTFAVLLAVASAMVAVGAQQMLHGAGLIAGGLLLAGWSWLVLGEWGDS